MEQESALLNLPTDALLAVLAFLSVQDLLRCASCCRLLCAVSRSECLWLSLCKPWRHLVDLSSWRSSLNSGSALFRLLSAFDSLVGPWAAQGNYPRGSLFYITWRRSCLVAYKVLARMTGELKLEEAFEIVGLGDGSFEVECISKDSKDPIMSSGKLVWDPRNSAEFSVQAIEHEEGVGHGGQVGRRSYNRLKVAEATAEGDLVGLWVGVYHNHWAEIINVTETREGIFATKILGDPNVPCGQVSFRASRRFETSSVPVELQQLVDRRIRTSFQTFNIAKWSEGDGRIADYNFRDPLWVRGRLLVSSSGKIAFLWQDMNFVVPFEKVNLAALYQSHKRRGGTIV